MIGSIAIKHAINNILVTHSVADLFNQSKLSSKSE